MSGKDARKKRESGLKSLPVNFPEINLDDLESSRNALAEYVKAYANGKIKEGKARTITYMFTGYLAYLRAEAELKIMERIQALEEKVYEHQKNN